VDKMKFVDSHGNATFYAVKRLKKQDASFDVRRRRGCVSAIHGFVLLLTCMQ
jgi:hypothetical protein